MPRPLFLRSAGMGKHLLVRPERFPYGRLASDDLNDPVRYTTIVYLQRPELTLAALA